LRVLSWAGVEHVSKGGGKGVGGIFVFDKKGDPKARAAKCLACHEESKNLAFWIWEPIGKMTFPAMIATRFMHLLRKG